MLTGGFIFGQMFGGQIFSSFLRQTNRDFDLQSVKQREVMINTCRIENCSAGKKILPNASVKPSFGDKIINSQWKKVFNKTSLIKTFLANRLLNALPDIDFARLLPHLQTVSFGGGEDVYQPDGSSDFLYFPETAVFSQLNILEDGRTVETAMIGSEGIAGMSSVLSFQPATPWTQTLVAGSALRINAQILKQEFNRGGFLQAELLDYLNSYVRQISQKVICSSHHRIEERFSTWLLMLDDRNAQDKLVLTHDQIAHFLGVHRPSVSGVAQDLRDDGVIDYIRGQIFILDRQRLKSVACECYSSKN